MPTLTFIDAARIQDFVFGSGRLRDAVGASQLVDEALGELLWEAGWEAGSDRLQAAGGAGCLRSDNHAAAVERTATLTRRLLDAAPGLNVVVEHEDYAADSEAAAAFGRLLSRLAWRKLEPAAGAALDRIAVTAGCARTAEPAGERVPVGTGDDELLSARVGTARRRTIGGFTAPWLPELRAPRAPSISLDLPLDLDRLGRTEGRRSVIGVVHVDGNRVGERIRRWLQDNPERFLEDMPTWSEKVAGAGQSAATAVLDAVLAAVVAGQDGIPRVDPKAPAVVAEATASLRFELKRSEGAPGAFALPVRPVLVGGDDVTFVCDGRIALSLARIALESFARTSVEPLPGDRLTACAGVAIVPVHAPFSAAYELSEQLCLNAKRLSRAHGGCAAIDWHSGNARPGIALADLRRREYAGGADGPPNDPRRWTASRRPYPLEGELSFSWLVDDLLDGPRGLRTAWRGRRGKVKELRVHVRDGEPAMRRALDAWRREARRRQSADEAWFPDPIEAGAGFVAGRTPLLDALELLDMHLPLPSAEPQDLEAAT